MTKHKNTMSRRKFITTRSNLAIPQNDILQINPNTSDGRSFGLHPSMPDMQQQFENGNLAFLANVGTLVEPTTKLQMQNESVRTPLGLFSHSDQQQQWQTGRPHERSNTGWGGKIADLVQSMNSNQNISMNISLRGTNIFQKGDQIVPYAINNRGSIGINNYGRSGQFNELKTAALNTMLERDYQDVYKNAYKSTIKTSNDSNLEFQEAIDTIADFSAIFPEDNNLAAQLRMVAKTIASRDTLGFSRQIFYVHIGGWDHHDELLISQSDKLTEVNQALKYFNDVLTELNVNDSVTTFSVSDFARTLTSNGNGTDHAWGGNAFMMGGAVKGKEIYGTYPSLVLNDDCSTNRFYEYVMMKTQKIYILILAFLGAQLITAQCYPDRHSTNWFDGWVSCETSPNPKVAYGDTHWIMYDLGYDYVLNETQFWNANEPKHVDFGINEYHLDYSL